MHNEITALVRAALKEDIGKGDITSDILIPKRLNTEAYVITKQDGVLAGLDVAKLVFALTDKKVKFLSKLKDGARLKNGKVIAKLKGPAKGILKAERTALNFLGHLCGVATLTNRFVKKAKGTNVKIFDTRKTTPLLRVLEKRAVKAGGGFNHRMGLYDQVLIKDNHLSAISYKLSAVRKEKISLEKIIKYARKKVSKKILIEIEVKNLSEFKDALNAKPDIIMLDNMNLAQIREAVKMRDNFLLTAYSLKLKAVKLEVSGGVNLKNVRTIAKTGVDMISIGTLTHSAPALDISLEIVG